MMRTQCAGFAFFFCLFCTGARLDGADYGSTLDKEAEMILALGQEMRLEAIRKEFGDKIDRSGKQLAALIKDEVGKIRMVLTPVQNEKLRELNLGSLEHEVDGLAQRIAGLAGLDLTEGELAKIGRIRKEYRPKVEKAMKELDSILSQEQAKARRDAIDAGKKASQVWANLNLAQAQKEKVAAVGKKISSLVSGELGELKDALTPDQKVLLLTLKGDSLEHVRDRLAQRIARLEDLNLTDKQKAAIARIRKEYQPKIHDAGNNLRELIRQEVTMIAAVFKE
jgi:Spy/CpxP family protein refolding chaperone